MLDSVTRDRYYYLNNNANETAAMNTFTATEKALAKMTNTNLRGPGYTLVNLRSRAAQVDCGLITFSEATAALTVKKAAKQPQLGE